MIFHKRLEFMQQPEAGRAGSETEPEAGRVRLFDERQWRKQQDMGL
jgi:hypothetical protein